MLAAALLSLSLSIIVSCCMHDSMTLFMLHYMHLLTCSLAPPSLYSVILDICTCSLLYSTSFCYSLYNYVAASYFTLPAMRVPTNYDLPHSKLLPTSFQVSPPSPASLLLCALLSSLYFISYCFIFPFLFICRFLFTIVCYI